MNRKRQTYHKTGNRGTGQLKPDDPFNGVLLVDKPTGMTSHDVVAKIRGYFRFKKVGHGGTLDPAATGLLIVLIGRGTKLSQTFLGDDKTYEGVCHLGVETDTQDTEGKIVAERDARAISRVHVEEEIKNWMGDIAQIPPMTSAIKKNGVPLYKLARKGKTVERDPKIVHIYTFDVLDFDAPFFRFRVKCSKGTYIRTLCADMGTALGCGGHLKELRRIQSGSLHIDDALALDDILALSLEQLGQRVLSANDLALT